MERQDNLIEDFCQILKVQSTISFKNNIVKKMLNFILFYLWQIVYIIWVFIDHNNQDNKASKASDL